MAFYGAYHADPMNQLIHFFFVPAILWSALVLLAYLPLVKTRVAGYSISWATIVVLIYVFYYCTMDQVGGVIFSAVLVAFAVSASLLVDKRYSSAWKWAIIVQIVSWVMQIGPGHAYFEGVKPALLDSLSQAFGVAPLFAFYEGIFYLGWAQPLKHAVEALVAEERVAMCARAAYSFCK